MLRCLSDPFGCAISAVPGWAWVVLTACALLFVIGLALNLSTIAKGIAGWPGVAAMMGALVTVFFVLWPKRKSFSEPLEQLPDDDRDALPPVTRPRPRKKRSSILGGSILPWNRK